VTDITQKPHIMARAAIKAYHEGMEANTMKVVPDMKERISDELQQIETFLHDKNDAYGNSALDPVRVFSRTDTAEQLRVRIDDKLSRLMRGREYPGDDTVLDLVGYLVLLRIAEKGDEEDADIYRQLIW
jgi:hypothetical protein